MKRIDHKSAGRVFALLLALAMTLGAQPAVFAASPSDFANGETYLRTSFDDDNYLTFSVRGDALTVGGKLRLEGLTGVMVSLGGETQYLDAANERPFSASFSLAALRGTASADVYTRLAGKSSYWSMLWDRVYVERTASGCRLLTSPVTESNLAFLNEWVNPADYLDASGVSDAVRALSDEIAGGADDEYEKLFLLHKWAAENLYYDYDAFYRGESSFYDPDDVLASKRSVCAGYSSLLKDLIRAQGIPCMETLTYALGVSAEGYSFARMPEYASETAVNHAHVEAFVGGRWVTMDATWDSRNRYENGAYHENAPDGYYYFDATPEAFALDHRILERGGDLWLRNGQIVSANTVKNGKKPSAWAIDEAGKALSLGLIPYALQGGYQSEISREDFCHMIVNMLRVREGAADVNALLAKHGLAMRTGLFTDTADDDVYAAYLLGIVGGVGDGRFSPGRAITRQEAAVMLGRAASVMGLTPRGAETRFADIGSAAEWAADAIRRVSALVSQDGSAVMGGTGDGFSPLGGYTVEQSILTVYRLFRCA